MDGESTRQDVPERPAATAAGGDAGVSDRIRELEHVIVRCEGMVRGLQQRVTDLELAHRTARKRALLFRLALLLLLLSAYVLVRARYSA
jgi:hypothetical protein